MEIYHREMIFFFTSRHYVSVFQYLFTNCYLRRMSFPTIHIKEIPGSHDWGSCIISMYVNQDSIRLETELTIWRTVLYVKLSIIKKICQKYNENHHSLRYRMKINNFVQGDLIFIYISTFEVLDKT